MRIILYHKYRLALFMVLSSVALLKAANDGDLDPSFGGSGYVTGPAAIAGSVVMQPDGKIVAAGISGPAIFRVTRYNTDGSLDTTSFGVPDGYVTGPVGVAASVVMQSDGKIVVAGSDGTNFRVARYMANGSLDTTSFGAPNGYVTGPVGVAISAVMQPDGKIVVAGYYDDGLNVYFRIARYNTNGSLDTTSFGAPNGYITGFVGNVARGVVIQTDGKIIAAGGGVGNFLIARYNIDGSLDTTSFGVPNGYVAGPVGTAYGVKMQSDGKIIAAGNDGINFRVARYKTDGNLDITSFGAPNGYVTGPSGTAYGVAMQSDGKIIAAGGGVGNFLIARYNIDGSLDTTSFGTPNGYVTGPAASAYGVTIQADGKIIAAGGDVLPDSNNFRVARYFGEQVDPFVSEVTFCTNCGPIAFGNRGCRRSLLYAVGCDVQEVQFFSVVPTFTQIDSAIITAYDIETLVEPDCASCE